MAASFFSAPNTKGAVLRVSKRAKHAITTLAPREAKRSVG